MTRLVVEELRRRFTLHMRDSKLRDAAAPSDAERLRAHDERA